MVHRQDLGMKIPYGIKRFYLNDHIITFSPGTSIRQEEMFLSAYISASHTTSVDTPDKRQRKITGNKPSTGFVPYCRCPFTAG